MKKILLILMMAVMTILLAACGEQKSIDEKFVESLANSLETKWAMEAKTEDVTKESLLEIIDAELSTLKKYEENVFENKELGKLAKKYISILNESKEALDNYDTLQWEALCFNIYKKSAITIANINEIIPLSISEERKTDFETMINDGKKNVDEWFMESLAKGLGARWKLTNSDKNKDTLTKSDWEGYFLAEDNFINQYKDENFEDKNLEKWAKKYVNSIVESKEVLKYFDTNQWTSKYSNDIYQDRVQALYNINAIIPVPVTEEWQEELGSLVIDGEVSDMVGELLKKVKFEEKSDEYGWKTYECVVKNTTNTNFEYFAFDINLIDKDGVTVKNESAWAENWLSGEKMRFTFETNEKFEKMNIISAEWSF